MRRGWCALFVAGASLGLIDSAQAQVYRCEVAGRVTFTDEPCLGGQRVEVVPTKGLDRLSGVSRKGADVRREERNRAFDLAVRPVTGKSHEEMNVLRRRHANHLTPQEHLKCQLLDGRIGELELKERASQGEAKVRVQADLLAQRKAHRQLGC